MSKALEKHCDWNIHIHEKEHTLRLDLQHRLHKACGKLISLGEKDLAMKLMGLV